VFESVTYTSTKNYLFLIFSAMNLLHQRIGGHEGISKLLCHFYADVRQDPLVGPIFNAKIKDWKHHLEIITSFWETLIGGPSSYARPMPMKHRHSACGKKISSAGFSFDRQIAVLSCPAMSRKK
jgi:truncated hemoglobin YjbI